MWGIYYGYTQLEIIKSNKILIDPSKLSGSTTSSVSSVSTTSGSTTSSVSSVSSVSSE